MLEMFAGVALWGPAVRTIAFVVSLPLRFVFLINPTWLRIYAKRLAVIYPKADAGVLAEVEDLLEERGALARRRLAWNATRGLLLLARHLDSAERRPETATTGSSESSAQAFDVRPHALGLIRTRTEALLGYAARTGEWRAARRELDNLNDQFDNMRLADGAYDPAVTELWIKTLSELHHAQDALVEKGAF